MWYITGVGRRWAALKLEYNDMANIHHATVKAAKAKGVTLERDEDGVIASIQTKSGERSFSIGVDDEADGPAVTEAAKDMWANLMDALAWEAEHPGFQIEMDDGDYVLIDTKDGERIACDPDFADLIETANEAAEGAQEDEDEGDEPESRSVVPPRYKKLYAERGHPAHCGDWLAVTLNGFCLDEKGANFNLATMAAICEANGIDADKYRAVQTRGWQGRFRMTTRNVLTKVIVQAEGVLHIPAEASGGEGDLELRAPAGWMAENTPKAKGKAAVQA